MAQKTYTQAWGYDLFKGIVTVLLVILLLVLLVRCGGATRTTVPTPVAQVEASPTATMAPTTAPTATPTTAPTTVPTATPEPVEPSPTALPSATPEPTLVVAPPTLDLPDAAVRVGEWALQGTGTPGSTVRVTLDGQEAGEVEVGPDGKWSLPVTVNEPGEHEVSLETVTDGQVVAAADPFQVEVAEPETQPEPVAEPGPLWTFPTAGDALRAGPVELRGTGDPDTEVEVLDGDVVVGTATVQAGGTWRFTYELSQGSRALSARYAGKDAGSSEVTMVSVIPVQETCPVVQVPAGESRCPADPPPGEDRGDTYVVAWCETISLIAERAGVSVQDLLAVNPEVCNPNLIYEGQVLRLPPRE